MTDQGKRKQGAVESPAPDCRAEAQQFRRALLPNSTPVPNWILDGILPIAGMKPSAIKVLLFLWRKTVGWNKQTDHISLSQIMRGCRVGRHEAIGALKLWNATGIVSVGPGFMGRRMNCVTVNPNVEPKDVLDRLFNLLLEQNASKWKRKRERDSKKSDGDW